MRRLALVAALVACSGGGARKQESAKEKPRVEKARRADVFDRVLITGTLQATSAAELRVPRTNVWELAIKWMAEDGTVVKKGDRLLEFDTSSFSNQLAERRLQYIIAVLDFRAFLDVDALAAEQKQFELETHRIALAKAKVRASVPPDLLAARDAQERQLELRRAEAAVVKAEKELASTKAASSLDKQVKQIELDKVKATIDDAEKSINELILSAPRDGIAVVGDHPWMGRKLQIADTVWPGLTVISLPDAGAGMEVRAELSDVDDGRVSLGMTGSCTLDAYPTEAKPCSVKSLMPVASQSGGAGGRGGNQSLRRGFSVVLAIEGADSARMVPGMSVKVELKRPPIAGAIVVPRGAVQLAKDNKVRVRLASGQQRDVELGACDPQACVVTKGVSDGEAVLVGGEP